MWPEKVERLISIDWRSPMSASTSSKTGSDADSAGGRKPAWCRSAASPSVFSATVLPPVFGPLITSARSAPSSRSIGTAVFGSSSGCRASSSCTSSAIVTSAPRQPRETTPRATARSIAAVASTSATTASARAPTAADSSRRMRSTSSRSALADLGVLVRHLDELERLDEDRLAGVRDVVDDPRHAAARARAHGEDGPAAALGDEVLLQVVAQRRRAREPAQLLGGALLVVAQLLAQAAQLGRGRVAQPGAVRLDRAVDLLGDRRQVGSIGSRAHRAAASDRRARHEPAVDRRRDARERLGRQRPAARGQLRRLAHVVDPGQRRLLRELEEPDHL